MADGAQYARSRRAPRNRNKNKHEFCGHDDINRLRDLSFSQNQPLNSASDYYTGIFKNKIKTREALDNPKNPEDSTFMFELSELLNT